MSIDGIFLHYIAEELKCCVGCRADKIHQPSKDELVFVLRSASFTGKLLLTAKSGTARIHITEAQFENPPEPPNFCKLLRKHLSSAKIVSIEQVGLDRIVKICFMSYNEMGDKIYPFIMAELITGKANIILCDQTGRIIDAMHRSDIERSSRIIQPGAIYALPETQEKINPFLADQNTIISEILSSRCSVSSVFCSVLEGVSPLVSRELAFLSGADTDMPSCDCDKKQIKFAVEKLNSFVSANKPYLIENRNDGSARDFSYMPILQYGNIIDNKIFPTYSKLLDNFFEERDADARIKAKSQDIIRLLSNIKNRIQRRLSYRLEDLARCENRENLRIYGELIKANIYIIERGMSSVKVQNYYDENLSEIIIPLDPTLSPASNAAKYFKEYKKSYTAEQTLSKLVKSDEKELIYIESVVDSLSRCKTIAELDEIRDELAEAGYILRRANVKRKPITQSTKEFRSPNGFKILVGRNNRENDLLTLKVASKNDIWFHTKNIAGSHVILITDGKVPKNDDLVFAASLAAAHSNASFSDNVPVDFTDVRFVKKPSGAKPGMVLYNDYKTIFVKPYNS